EWGHRVAIRLVIIGRKRLSKMRPRAEIIALEPARYAEDVHGPARRWQVGQALRVTQGGQRHLAHRRKVGANKTDQPHAVIGREPRGRVFDSRGKLAGARKRSHRLWLAVPATVKYRMAVRGLQPQPEESLGRPIGQSFGQTDRLFEVRDRLIAGGSVQSPVARLDPPFDGRFVEPRLCEMMGDDLR